MDPPHISQLAWLLAPVTLPRFKRVLSLDCWSAFCLFGLPLLLRFSLNSSQISSFVLEIKERVVISSSSRPGPLGSFGTPNDLSRSQSVIKIAIKVWPFMTLSINHISVRL